VIRTLLIEVKGLIDRCFNSVYDSRLAVLTDGQGSLRIHGHHGYSVLSDVGQPFGVSSWGIDVFYLPMSRVVV
jgi:hypothetical protein